MAAIFLLVASTTASGSKIDDTQLAQFKRGVTTLQEVEAKLGPPQATEQQADSAVEIDYWQTSVHTSWYSRLPFLGGTGHVVSSSDRVVFDFAPNGKLIDYNRSQMQLDSRDLRAPVSSSS